MLILPGSNALSSFRAERLLSRVQAIEPGIIAITGRFTHFVEPVSSLSEQELARLSELLTYGDAVVGNSECDQLGHLFVVIPRFGTISPWASKATEIAQHCGIAHIKRIERGIRYRVLLKKNRLGTQPSLTS